MHLFVHKDRHIVVSETEKPESGQVRVAWVSLTSDLEGSKKRGRRPNYDKPVPVAELAPLPSSEDTEVLHNRAAMVLAEVAPRNTEQ